MAIQPIPEGYHTATPYLIVKGAGRAIEFYKRAFGASEVMRMDVPNGRIGHAEIRIGIHRSCWPMSIRRWAFGVLNRSAAREQT
jgi:PhnB protein